MKIIVIDDDHILEIGGILFIFLQCALETTIVHNIVVITVIILKLLFEIIKRFLVLTVIYKDGKIFAITNHGNSKHCSG